MNKKGIGPGFEQTPVNIQQLTSGYPAPAGSSVHPARHLPASSWLAPWLLPAVTSLVASLPQARLKTPLGASWEAWESLREAWESLREASGSPETPRDAIRSQMARRRLRLHARQYWLPWLPGPGHLLPARRTWRSRQLLDTASLPCLSVLPGPAGTLCTIIGGSQP